MEITIKDKIEIMKIAQAIYPNMSHEGLIKVYLELLTALCK